MYTYRFKLKKKHLFTIITGGVKEGKEIFKCNVEYSSKKNHKYKLG